VSRLAPLIAVVALTVLVGCGSAGDDASTPADAAASGAESLTKGEFITKADALCESSRAKQEPARQRLEEVAAEARAEEQAAGGASDETRSELAQTLRQIVAMAEAGLSQLQALGAPEADSKQLEAIFKKTESAFETSLAYGAALESHEDAAAQEIAASGNVEGRETSALAKHYGFKVCGSQP